MSHATDEAWDRYRACIAQETALAKSILRTQIRIGQARIHGKDTALLEEDQRDRIAQRDECMRAANEAMAAYRRALDEVA